MGSELIPKFVNPLEDLLAHALVAQTPQKRRQRHNEADRNGEFQREIYANPDNWNRIGGVILMHQDSNTLLGNYSEYRNGIDPKARKLVHELEPIAIDKTEWVQGPQWLAYRPELESPSKTFRHVEVTVDVLLGELGVAGQGVGLMVTLIETDLIQRATLSLQTTFHAADGSVAFVLPRGLNILPGMSFDSKLALRAELFGAGDERETSDE